MWVRFCVLIPPFLPKTALFSINYLVNPEKSSNFAASIKNRLGKMNTVTLNPSMMHDWEIISADESLMQRLARYMRRLVKEKEPDPTLMTKEEFFAMVDRAEEQYSRGEYTELLPGETVTDMLRRCGYDV